MAVVTRDSNSAGAEMERADMRVSYVRGLVVAASERSERSRSLRVCCSLSWGRFGVAVGGSG